MSGKQERERRTDWIRQSMGGGQRWSSIQREHQSIYGLLRDVDNPRSASGVSQAPLETRACSCNRRQHHRCVDVPPEAGVALVGIHPYPVVVSVLIRVYDH